MTRFLGKTAKDHGYIFDVIELLLWAFDEYFTIENVGTFFKLSYTNKASNLI